MNSWRIGGVTLELREDGNFSIYQPDTNRVLSKELALEVSRLIFEAYPKVLTVPRSVVLFDSATDTIPDGVLTSTEQEADKNALEATAQLDVGELVSERKRVLNEMTATAHADGTDELATEFIDTRASIARGVADVEQGNVKPAPASPTESGRSGSDAPRGTAKRRGRWPKNGPARA